MSVLPPESRREGESGRDWEAEFRSITEGLSALEGASQIRSADKPRLRSTHEDTSHHEPASPQPWRPASGPPLHETVDDDFVPPDPAPLRKDDPATIIMIGGLVLGPLWLIYLAVFARDAATIWWIFACLLLGLGLVLAVARQPRTRDDDETDDGARL